MEPLPLIVALAALLIGLAAGWFFGSRPAAQWKARHAERDAQAREQEASFRQAIAELGEARIEVATLKANAENFDRQLDLMRQAREDLLKEFQNTGNKVLGAAQEAFLRRADERFRQAEETGEQKLKALLTPVGERLQSYERQVAELEAKRVDAFGHLTALMQTMSEGQRAVQAEAMKLSSALTNAPKARGRWGEQQLKNLLETCGLAEHTDFSLEHSIDTEEGRLRPDAIVRIPGGKVLVIDAKVSLNAYQEAFAADSEEARRAALEAHVRSMKNHVQQLGAKSYQSQFEEAPDYVVMFVPGEHFVAAALEYDPQLWDFAFEKKVLLATPTNLVAIARTVAQVWRQDALAQEAREIGRLASELYDRIAIAGEHLKRVGSGLETAVGNYNKFVGSYERNVLSSARRLRDKGIETGKRDVDEVHLVESAPRYTAADLEEPPPARLVDTAEGEDARSEE